MGDEDRVAALLGDWWDRREQGEAIAPDELIRAHPELADALRDGFAALGAAGHVFHAPDASPAPVPATIGPYGVLRELGSGGMGTVYLARDESGGRVALKVVHPHLLERRGFFQRFLREAELGRRVLHENVVRTIGVDAMKVGAETTHFLAMEYVEGRTLQQLLEDLDTVPEALLRKIAQQAASGLAAIHAAGIVHRDLKPENLLITDDHRVRIMDLGVARGVDGSMVLTKEGQFAGSLLYAAPEQFQKGRVGPAADLYSLGVLLYELATGENPFVAEDAASVMNAHLERVPPRANERNPAISIFLAEILAALLEKDPAQRFESAASLGEVLAGGEHARWWTQREHEVLQATPIRPRVPVRRETSLYGREADLALLRQGWTEARSGRGNTLLLEGEAGIGKSRLVDAFLAELDGEEVTVLYGSYPPSGGLGGLSDAILEYFGAAKLEETLAPYLAVTPRLVPAFAALVKHEAAPEGSTLLQGDALHAIFVNLMRALAEERPLVWIVEDLHFAPSDSRQILLSLARALEGRPILLCLTTRPELPEKEVALFSRLGTLRRVPLGRISAREVILLLQDAFRSEALADKLGARIALKSDGVPFFVFEMIRGLKEGQFITQLPDGSYIESKVIDEIEVPSAVRDLIEVRLGDLTKEERVLLDAGSVQGFAFDPDLVAAVLERRLLAVLQDLAAVERRVGVIRAKDDQYRFDHHQIQEVVYDEMPSSLRREYHSLVADAIQENADGSPSSQALPLLATHHLRGRHPKRALPHLVPALDRLADVYRHEEAIELAARALALSGVVEGATRIDVLINKTARHQDRGERELQREAAEEALHLARELEDRRAEALALGALARADHSLGRLEAARSSWEAQRALSSEMGDDDGVASATVNLGHVYEKGGDETQALAAYEEGLALARRAGSRRWCLNARVSLAFCLTHRGAFQEAEDHLQRALALAREIGDERGEVRAMYALGLSSTTVRRLEDGRAWYERALDLARKIGDREAEITVSGGLGSVLYTLGRRQEAWELKEQQLVLCREIGSRVGEAYALAWLGRLHADRGDAAKARELLRDALDLSLEIGYPQAEATVRNGLAILLHQVGHLGEALEAWERLRELLREGGPPLRLWEGAAAEGLGEILYDLGQVEKARQSLEHALEFSRELGLHDQWAHNLHLLARIAADEGATDRALELEEQALELWRGIEDRPGVLTALVLLSRVEEVRGNADRAVSQADEALALAEEIGRPGVLLLAHVRRAALPGGNVEAACQAYMKHGERVGIFTRMGAQFALWELTGQKSHIEEAHRLLSFAHEHAPGEYRESMLKNVRLNREIMEAWAAHGGESVGEAVDEA